jgi:hypothetical protein
MYLSKSQSSFFTQAAQTVTFQMASRRSYSAPSTRNGFSLHQVSLHRGWEWRRMLTRVELSSARKTRVTRSRCRRYETDIFHMRFCLKTAGSSGKATGRDKEQGGDEEEESCPFLERSSSVLGKEIVKAEDFSGDCRVYAGSCLVLQSRHRRLEGWRMPRTTVRVRSTTISVT